MTKMNWKKRLESFQDSLIEHKAKTAKKMCNQQVTFEQIANSPQKLAECSSSCRQLGDLLDCFIVKGARKETARKTDDEKQEDSDEEPSDETRIEKIYNREIIVGGRDCLLGKQMYLLYELTTNMAFLQDMKNYIKRTIKIARELRATGFKIDDRFLANLILSRARYRYPAMTKEISDSKCKITLDLVKRKVYEHANRRYLCNNCKNYSENELCACIVPDLDKRMIYVERNGRKVLAYRNY